MYVTLEDIHDILCVFVFQRILDDGVRHRSNAFGEGDSPNTAKLRRHSSSRDMCTCITRGQIMVEVPRSILRGSGFSAYHVYEVKVSIFSERGSLVMYKKSTLYYATHFLHVGACQ